MSYLYDYKLKNVGGRETVERIDLHEYTSINFHQRWINNKLISTCKLTNNHGYVLTLDFDDRPIEAFDFLSEWRESIKSRRPV
jgi:hypothetical protein